MYKLYKVTRLIVMNKTGTGILLQLKIGRPKKTYYKSFTYLRKFIYERHGQQSMKLLRWISILQENKSKKLFFMMLYMIIITKYLIYWNDTLPQ